MRLNNIYNFVLIPLFSLMLNSCHKAEIEKPNIILVITDDQGYGDLSCHGNPWIKTPNIDALHSESVRLTDFHVTSTCSPTRGALLTGHYSNRSGAWHTVCSREMIFEDEILLPQILQNNGYSTAIFGKWHLGDNHPFRPQDRGFSETFIHLGGGVGQTPDYWGNNYFDDTYFRNGKPEKTKGYCTDVWFDNAINYIQEKTDKKKPFFCYLSLNAPHSPYYAPNHYTNMYRNNPDVIKPSYYGMITNIDDNMGRLLEFMNAKKISDNTIFIFMTDNGTSNGAGVRLDKDGFPQEGFNAGMRGSKVSMYEGGHRVPFFIRWPKGGIEGGFDIDELTAHIDILPTLVDALNLKGTDSINFDGESIVSLLRREKVEKKNRIIVTDTQRNITPKKWRMSSVMQNKWRLINGNELYNLSTDSGQRYNIAKEHPAVVQRLRDGYEAYWQSIMPDIQKWQHITLCDKSEPITIISAMELIPDSSTSIIWRQEHLRAEIKKYKGSGYYNIQTPKTAHYKFTLMRYPPESALSLGSVAPADEAILHSNVRPYKEAIALDIEKAIVQIDNQDPIEIKVDPNLVGASVCIEIFKGKHKLRTHFITSSGDVYPAMYTVVQTH